MEELPSIRIKRYLHSNGFQNHKRFSSFDYGKNKNSENNNYFRGKQELNNNMNYLGDLIIIENKSKDEKNSNRDNIMINSYSKSNSNKKDKKNNNSNIIPQTYYKFFPKLKTKKSKTKVGSKSYNNLKNIQDNINMDIYKDNLLLPVFQKDKDNYFDNIKQVIQKKENISYSILNKENKNNSPQNNINNSIKDNIYDLKHNLMNNYFNYTQKKKSSGNNFAITGFLSNNNKKYNNYYYFKSKTNVKKKRTDIEYKVIKPFKAINVLNNNNNTLNKRKCPLCHKEVDNNRYRFHLNLHPSKILDWLYLGSYRDAGYIKGLKELGINYVLNCAIECLDSFPSNIKYCHLKISDMPSFHIVPYFERATSFINNAHINNGTILVHCQMGISRSTTCVIAYFIRYLGYTAVDALSFIKRKRPQVMPNFGFLQQLIDYEKHNLNYLGK